MSSEPEPEPEPEPIDPGNPCPFLRCAQNPDNVARTGVSPLGHGRTSVTELYAHARAHSGSRLFGLVVAGVGLWGNGFELATVGRNALTLSFEPDRLTGGPLDKPRADTKILQGRGSGVFCRDFFDRMIDRWGRPFVQEKTKIEERGLDLRGLHAMIQDNRREDDGNGLTTLAAYGEFIPALWLFGRRSEDGTRYLAESDLLAMFRDRRFPASKAGR